MLGQIFEGRCSLMSAYKWAAPGHRKNGCVVGELDILCFLSMFTKTATVQQKVALKIRKSREKSLLTRGENEAFSG